MIVDALIYLVQVYWPYLVAAGLIGLVTGWVTAGPERRKG